LDWVSQNSSNEGERFNNPANWFINNDVTYNTQVYLGGYNIDKTTADLCNKEMAFTPSIQHAQNIVNNTGRMDRIPAVANEYMYFTPSVQSKNLFIKVQVDSCKVSMLLLLELTMLKEQ
jgi:hypothetical protein